MYKYATEVDNEKHAKALGLALPISTKQSILICNYIRGKSLERALVMLEEVVAMKKPVPYTKFNRDTPHRKGMGPGRYPIKASKEIIKILQNASSNAQYKGMSVSNLHIKHICAHLASTPWHYGRKTRRKTKRTHLEVVLEEREPKKRKPRTKKVVEKPAEKKIKTKPMAEPVKKKVKNGAKSKAEPNPEVKKEVKAEPKSESKEKPNEENKK